MKRTVPHPSLRLRITLWFSLFLLLLAALEIGLMLTAARRTAVQSASDAINREISHAERAVSLSADGTLQIDSGLKSSRGGVYLSLFAADGRPLYGRVPDASAIEEPFSDGVLRTVGSENAYWYLLDSRISLSDGQELWIRGMMLSEGSGVLDSMTRFVWIALPALCLFALIGGYFLIGRALRPAGKLLLTARQIGDGSDLNRRIDLRTGPRELLALADAFDRMFDRLQAAFERETRFTADASHELRTPVSVALAQCDYALGQDGQPEEWRESLETVRQQLDRMAALIARLLALSRADRGQTRLQTERTDLSALLLLVAEQAEEAAAQKRIRVETDLEPEVFVTGDETLLLQMLLNLTENACKYGRQGGLLRLTLRKDADRQAAIGTVEDDGIGMTAEQLPHIWERFYRADAARGESAHTGTDGFGLGLPTVAYILKAHGGDISVRSEPGKGSLFTFTLPLSPEA